MMTARTVVLVAVVALLAGACAHADLTFVIKIDQLPAVQWPGEGVELPDPPVPVSIEDAPRTFWQVGMVTDGKWRRDAYEVDPAEEPEEITFSLIRKDAEKQTAMLDWDREVAQIIKDQDFEQMAENLAQLQEAMQNMPEGTQLPVGQMPPEMMMMLTASKPIVKLTVEGPLDTGEQCGFACELWRVIIETKDDEGVLVPSWGHTIDTTETWFTTALSVPQSDVNIFRWDPTLQSYLYSEALEEAAAEVTMPAGFPVKQHLETVDLIERTVEIADWELEGHSVAPIDPGKLEIPDGWEINEAAWGQPATDDGMQ